MQSIELDVLGHGYRILLINGEENRRNAVLTLYRRPYPDGSLDITFSDVFQIKNMISCGEACRCYIEPPPTTPELKAA